MTAASPENAAKQAAYAAKRAAHLAAFPLIGKAPDTDETKTSE